MARCKVARPSNPRKLKCQSVSQNHESRPGSSGSGSGSGEDFQSKPATKGWRNEGIGKQEEQHVVGVVLIIVAGGAVTPSTHGTAEASLRLKPL